MGERRLRNPEFPLNLADRQAALAGFDQEPKYLEAMRVAQLSQTTRGVPVLMYHAFADSGEADRFVLAKSSFARQMRLLAALRLI